MPIDGLKATAEYFRQRLREIKLEQLEIVTARKRGTASTGWPQLQQLNAGQQSRPVSEVVVAVDAPVAVRADFSISYLVTRRAGRRNDLRVKSVGEPVELGYKSPGVSAAAKTGRRCNSPSTGKPMSSAQRPVLNTWWLQEYLIVVCPAEAKCKGWT